MRILILMAFALISMNCVCQTKLNKLSVNPIQLIGYNRLNIEYERGFLEGKMGCTFYLGATGYASRKIHNQYSFLSEQNFAVKKYAKAIDIPCFWYGAQVSISSGNVYSADKADSSINIGALGILGTGGYQYYLSSFYINAYAGFGYSLTNNLFGSADLDPDLGNLSEWLLIYGIKIGYKF
jgi:hypothetical protein